MYYPAMLDLAYFKIVVVGGGKVAYRKVRQLQCYGGKVKVVSPELDTLFETLPQPFTYLRRPYGVDVLEGATLVMAATNDRGLNEAIGIYCQRHEILCNVATDEALSSFIVPASVQRGELVLSVTTGGASPALTTKIKEALEAQYPPNYADYVSLLGEARKKLKREMPDEMKRRQALKGLVDLTPEALRQFLLEEERGTST